MNQVHYVEPTGKEQFPGPDESAIRRHAIAAVTEIAVMHLVRLSPEIHNLFTR
jgi:hypothetical protein